MKNKESVVNIVEVMFRKDKESGEIVAFFPNDQEYPAGEYQSYMHIGQHGACTLEYINEDTDPILSNSAEKDSLLDELRNIGYNVKIIDRIEESSTFMDNNSNISFSPR